jgi:hypothetical protein
VARCVSRIADTYLERLFPPVALLGLPLDELTLMPVYRPSPIAVANPPPPEQTVDTATARSQRRSLLATRICPHGCFR